MLKQIYIFSKNTDFSSLGYGSKTDFSIGKSGGRLYGLYTKSRLLGTLEAMKFN